MIFYLGIHETAWMNTLDVPVMVSRRRLERNGTPRAARAPWILDSGGFTELSTYGRWSVSAAQYADEVERYRAEIPGLVWCAPRDWMVEPWIVEKTGLSVAEHQDRTVDDYLDLRDRGLPVIPVLQGWTLDDYLDHVEQYRSAGVDLEALPTVGLGSVCRREATSEIAEIVSTLALEVGLSLHGFGCKAGAIRRTGTLLASADSMAWSYAGRRRGTCEHLRSRCANHRHYALSWREDVLSHLHEPIVQPRLFR